MGLGWDEGPLVGVGWYLSIRMGLGWYLSVLVLAMRIWPVRAGAEMRGRWKLAWSSELESRVVIGGGLRCCARPRMEMPPPFPPFDEVGREGFLEGRVQVLVPNGLWGFRVGQSFPR